MSTKLSLADRMVKSSAGASASSSDDKIKKKKVKPIQRDMSVFQK